jgi:hypothetical protein
MNATDIQSFDVEDIPNSSFNVFLGRRRSGKSVLVEYLLKQMIDKKMLDLIFLFSPTDSGFDMIDKGSRYKDIDSLLIIVENYRLLTEYNKTKKKKRDKISLRCMIVLDDFAVKLKSKSFNILETLAVNGRHYGVAPLALHFCILSQSLTKIPRVIRLNTDHIFLNSIGSSMELNMILDENFYILDGSRQGKNDGRTLYNDLIIQQDYQFIVIENWRQNVRQYSDYVKTYRAII